MVKLGGHSLDKWKYCCIVTSTSVQSLISFFPKSKQALSNPGVIQPFGKHV